MTLVLSMNPFLDPEGDPPLSPYQPLWETECCTKSCLSNSAPPSGSGEQFTQEPHCRGVPDHVSVSRIAYFKRKFVTDDDSPFSFRAYCQTVAPVLEERAHVLRLSLEKMRFIDDPEAFLRRSVLVNNLLRRLRAEILLQSTDWCFPPNPGFSGSPCILPPGANPAHQALHGAVSTRICLAHQSGPPFRKRFRMVRGGPGELRTDCAQTCCCIYAAAAAAGHYIHLPFSMYDAALSACPSAPHSSLFQLGASQSKLGLTVAVEDQDDEEEDAEEEENEEEEERVEEDEENDERRRAGPSLDVVKDKSSQKSRIRTLLAQRRGHTRTEESAIVDGVEDDEEDEVEEEEEEEHAVGPCQWDSTVVERELHKVSFWHHRGHRQ